VTDAAAPREGHITVPRTARYYALGEAAAAREVWVALHGYGQLAALFARHFTPIADGRLVLVPEGLSRFYLESPSQRSGPAMAGAGAQPPDPPRVGATWMTREDRLAEIEDYVRYLDLLLDEATAGVDWARARLVVLGFSQGSVTACRWVERRFARGASPAAARLVLWGGSVPHDLDLAADGEFLRRTPLTYVVGRDDQYATPEAVARLRATLDAHAVPYEAVLFDAGHRMDATTLAAVAGAVPPTGPGTS
jgi:predicted esterase